MLFPFRDSTHFMGSILSSVNCRCLRSKWGTTSLADIEIYRDISSPKSNTTASSNNPTQSYSDALLEQTGNPYLGMGDTPETNCNMPSFAPFGQ